MPPTPIVGLRAVYHIVILVPDNLVSRLLYGDLFPASHSRFCPYPIPTLKRERLTERICDIAVIISGV